MRVLVKGGVWKNSEDEVLKAGVMKYGKSSWARVASLLNRKSAAQCKARWYEWLDPSIKKTDWSREEEEKLLHLAKLMPNQWRTIAPVVGRTAAQCMEQYEKLLDKAANLTSSSSGADETSNDPRKLRPGEIDPAPETKPARPDPIDMDDDEKEMLNEARARLMNTKGKKAKRKARQRQQEESRRLATLQKHRELKAAGIESRLGSGSTKRKYINLAKEIPYQKTVPAGFYDVGEENQIAKKMHLDPSKDNLEINRMEGRTSRDTVEKMKQREEQKLKFMFKQNAAKAIMARNEQNDPTSMRARSALALPAPQISENELEDIVKMSSNMLMPPPVGRPSGHSTAALVGDYSMAYKSAVNATPSHTPKSDDIIMQEAANLRLLRDMTPLSGKYNESGVPELFEGTGFEGSKPRVAVRATPNILLNQTPSIRGVSDTPMSVMSNSSILSTSTVRDAYGINSRVTQMDSMLPGEVAVNKQLKNLPAPEYMYEVAIPQLPDEDGVDEAQKKHRVEDASDVLERNKIQKQKLIEKELRNRSSVLRNSLPRLCVLSASAITDATVDRDPIKAMIKEEMIQLIIHDQLKFPPDICAQFPTPAGLIPSCEYGSDSDPFNNDSAYVQQARECIQEECDKATPMSMEEFDKLWNDKHKNLFFVPLRDGSMHGASKALTTKDDILANLKVQYNLIKSKLEADATKALKQESKVQVLTQGYVSRSSKLASDLTNSCGEYNRAINELNLVLKAKELEAGAVMSRMNKATIEYNAAVALEAQLQQKYSLLVHK